MGQEIGLERNSGTVQTPVHVHRRLARSIRGGRLQRQDDCGHERGGPNAGCTRHP